MNNQELLTRIEELETLTKRLEQTIRDIWNSCACLQREEEHEHSCEGYSEEEEPTPEEQPEEHYE